MTTATNQTGMISPWLRANDRHESYTKTMEAQSRNWKVVKTSGGYGVLKSVNGSTVSKKFVVRPSTLTSSKSARSVNSSVDRRAS